MQINKDYIFQIGRLFAKSNNLPVFFEGKIVRETPKAAYIVGKGTTALKAKGICFVCGTTLTHPVSIKLGIGPICGGHFWDWDQIGGYTEKNKKVAEYMARIKIDQWFPKSMIKEFAEVIVSVTILLKLASEAMIKL